MQIALCLLGWLLWAPAAWAQPANDNCTNATAIPLGGSNYGLGVFTTPTTNLTGATRQLGEYFDPVQITSGNDKKSVWYRFTLPTHRGVRVELMQPANDIPQADVGFTVYYAGMGNCLPGAAAIPPAKLTPLGKFGNTFNPCLIPGEYLIQVSAKDNALTNDLALSNIFLRLTTSYPDVLNNHDLHTAPYDFGTVSGTSDWNSWHDFGVGCLTREQTESACAELGANAADFTQSAWLTFRTDASVDFMRFQLRMSNIVTPKTPLPWKVGFRLFQGDATASATPWSSLSQLGTCTVLTASNDVVDLPCTLLPNTTYSIQLFLHKDHEALAGVRMYETGIGTTESPLNAAPPTMSAAHQMGTLPGSSGGTWYSRTDEWSCNARMNLNSCGTVKPAAGYTIGGVTYDMNNWVTFTLTQFANVTFRSFSDCNNLYNRLYSGDVNNNCNLSLYSSTEFQSNSGQNYQIYCLPAGTYSWQVLGSYGTPGTATCGSWPTTNSHLSQPMTISVNVANVDQQNQFDLATLARVNLVNETAGDAGPLPDNVTINSTSDRFGCQNTRLPQDVCVATPANTKAIYRVIRIGAGEAGLLTIGNLNFNFQYKIYRGDVRPKGAGAYPTTFNNTNFVDQIGCFNTQQTICVEEGYYTLVSFGDATDVGRSDQPNFRFQLYLSQFNLRTATRVNRVNYSAGAYVSLVSGVNYTTTLDRFDCTPTVLPASGVCNSASTTKAIYRQFRIGGNGLLTITGNC
ncbi:MAG: hypothetical protein KF690_08095, partial [Bacteroidetes bacterium]|nr:hypothetical protein [Bacteroidota bacterium]